MKGSLIDRVVVRSGLTVADVPGPGEPARQPVEPRRAQGRDEAPAAFLNLAGVPGVPEARVPPAVLPGRGAPEAGSPAGRRAVDAGFCHVDGFAMCPALSAPKPADSGVTPPETPGLGEAVGKGAEAGAPEGLDEASAALIKAAVGAAAPRLAAFLATIPFDQVAAVSVHGGTLPAAPVAAPLTKPAGAFQIPHAMSDRPRAEGETA